MTSTVERVSKRQVTTVDGDFDPLVEFQGKWDLELASRYLPIPELLVDKYECWDGRLYMTPPPAEALVNSFGEMELGALLRPGVKAAGLYLYAPISLLLGSNKRWIEPDLSVLDRGPEDDIAAPAEHCVMVVEFISPSSRGRDTIHKPKVCAEFGIPWFMTVDLSVKGQAVVELCKLISGQYVEAVKAEAGQRFEMTEPFAASFDPIELRPRRKPA